MSVQIIKGDLLKSDCTIIGHQANCYKMMGAGIAGQIAQQHPEAALIDQMDDRSPEQKYGHYTVAIKRGLIIYNMYGQKRPGGYRSTKDKQTRQDRFEEALHTVLEAINRNRAGIEINVGRGKIKFGLPYMIGCGIAGGDWETYLNIIEQASEEHGIDIYLYKLA